MKTKSFFSIILIMLLTINFVSGQDTQIPNSNFENWEAGSENEPVGWNILEIDLGITQFYSAEQTSDAAFDDWAVKLQTQSIFGQMMPGYIALGDFDIEEFMPSGGIPFADRPTGLEFSYKYSPQPDDSMLVLIMLTKWNEAEQKTDTIAGGYFSNSDEVSTYTRTTIPIFYQSEQEPDTINIYFVSSGMTPVAGSTLYVDSLEMRYDLINFPTLCLPATDTTTTGFQANWLPIFYSVAYIIDVATDNEFTNYLTGYEHKSVIGSYNYSEEITGIETNRYFYRLKVFYSLEQSEYSNIISVPMPTNCTEATDITEATFTANWTEVSSATNYLLDVATDENFNNLVSGFDGIETGLVNSYEAIYLQENTDYFYRIRVVYDNEISKNSNTTEVSTLVGINGVNKTEFKIYSDSKNIIIETQKPNSSTYAKVYDLTGRIISETEINSSKTKIQINHKGMCVVKVFTENNIYTQILNF